MPILSEGAYDPSDARTGWWVLKGNQDALAAASPGAAIANCLPYGSGGVVPGTGCPKSFILKSRAVSEVPIDKAIPCYDQVLAPGLYHDEFCSVNLPHYKHNCLAAVYNRTSGTWTCTRFGSRCGEHYLPCQPVPENALSVYVEDPLNPSGVVMQRANAWGEPIWESWQEAAGAKTTEEIVGSTTPSAPTVQEESSKPLDWSKVGMYAGLALLGLMLLRR